MDIASNLGSFVAAEVKTEDLQVPPGAGNSVEGTSLIDASFEDSLRFTLSWTDTTFLTQAQAQALEHSGKDAKAEKGVRMAGCDNVEMVITAPDGTIIDKTDTRYNYQSQFRLIIVDASGFPEGVWEYEVVNPSTGVCGARLRIEGFPDTSSPDDEKQPILMTAQTNKVNVTVQQGGNPLDNIVTLFVTLRQGLSPVVDAEVTADLAAGSYSHNILLSDDGQGADNTADDGIYSAYFYQYSGDGVYSVRAAAKGISGQTQILRDTRKLIPDSNGFKVVRTQSRMAVAAFERAAIGGAVEVAVNGVSDMNAIIPPARINDFRRSGMTEDSVQLTWTAVGESMNDGTASRYEVRLCANSTEEWSSCMEIDDSMLTAGNVTNPKPSGSQEHISISLDYLVVPAADTAYYVRIKAVDQYGNMGVSSNLAQVKGPVTPDVNSGAIIAGTLACLAVVATATLGGVIIHRNKKQKQVHPVI